METSSKNKSSTVCRQILDARDVVEGQILSDLLNNDVLKNLALTEKKAIALQIKAKLVQQFDNLIDRVQKELL